jgi:hypothetical protein
MIITTRFLLGCQKNTTDEMVDFIREKYKPGIIICDNGKYFHFENPNGLLATLG